MRGHAISSGIFSELKGGLTSGVRDQWVEEGYRGRRPLVIYLRATIRSNDKDSCLIVFLQFSTPPTLHPDGVETFLNTR